MNINESFLAEYLRRYPRITLIGMSGLGKSYWSTALEAEGFKRFCCDDMITEFLSDDLKTQDGDILDIGRWMGFPFDPGYKQREQVYLSREIEVLGSIIAYIEAADKNEKIVIDTTGSAPYAGDALMRRLASLSGVIHLATSEAYYSTMLARYIENPRPVLWGNDFRKKNGETDQEALAHSYRNLLAHRENLYGAYARHSVPYERHRFQPGD